MLTAALDGLIDRFGLEGETLGEVAGGAVLKHSHDRDLTRESVLSHPPRPRDPRLRRPAGLRDRPRDGDPGRQQDRPRADRRRHRLRRRHHLRRADRAERGAPRDAARRQPAALDQRQAEDADPLPPRPHRPPRPPQRGAAHRPLDGRAHGDHGDRMGDRPGRAGRARGRLPPATSPPPTSAASRPT